jgi:hypothetical protein
VAGPEHQTTSYLFIFGLPTKWYFLLSLLVFILSSLKTVSPALPGDLICCLSSNCCMHDAWRTCHNGFVFVLLFVSAMLAVTIVAIVASSAQPLTPALAGKMLQFAFVVHTLRRLMSLWQYLSLRYEYHRDTHNALTMPLLHSSTRPSRGFKADRHGLPHCI